MQSISIALSALISRESSSVCV